MNKSWWAIVGGSVIIIAVMVFLTIKGVVQREHTFIKWSQVDGSQKMAEASVLRLFPMLRENNQITIVSNEPLGESFYQNFGTALEKEHKHMELRYVQTPPEAFADQELVIELFPLSTSEKPGSCADTTQFQCLVYKAQRKWHKKERSKENYWFMLQWVKHNRFYIFYTNPNT